MISVLTATGFPARRYGRYFHCFTAFGCGLRQQWVPGNDRKVGNVSVFTYQSTQDHGPLNSVLPRFIGVFWIHSLDQQPGRYSLRQVHRRVLLHSGLRLIRGKNSLRLRFAESCMAACAHRNEHHQCRNLLCGARHLKPPAPAPAACSANSAARQSESRSNTRDTSWWSDQAASLPDSFAPPARSPAAPQGSKPQPR
jgi:hypothetical protein